jgi:hypothetical protein
MSALIAIPTHERETLVRHCLGTAAEMETPPGSEIVVFDDASPSLAVEQIMEEAGLAPTIRRSPRRRGPSGMIYEIWRHFLGSPHAHLLILDSDMIANRSALVDGLRLRQGFAGLITLYNSRLHPGSPAGEDLVLKESVGNAGTLWTRHLVVDVLKVLGNEVPANVDDAYSRLFSSRKIPMLAPHRSRLQHLGILGANNRYFGSLEHGLNFVPDSERQLRAIAATYDDLMVRQEYYLRPRRRGVLSRWLRGD